ncbi:MAG TPA: tail fiber protein [Blastocatellia bacterium]
MAQPYIGQIVILAGGFPPRGWAFCDGQRLSIRQNTTLFSLIGITYGGDGRSSFALPDLRGKAPIGAGQGAGAD